MTSRGRLGILVGGGPAPGINAVISAATIEAINEGFEVVGIRDGFKHLVRRDLSKLAAAHHRRRLAHAPAGRLHARHLAREPDPVAGSHAAVIETLRQAGITHLMTIGGDDTALSSRTIAEHSTGAIRTVHVPKTIDNDLPLPQHVPTFGFQTARHVGVELVRNLMEDARSTRRWYVVVAMGRKAGHLALGIGKAAGATLTLIAEEFASPHVPFAAICDIVEGAIIKRQAMGRHFGVAVLAEGLIEKLDPAELAGLQDVERDEHGHVRFAEVDLARKVKAEVQGRFSQRGIRVTITDKNVGYELRCADPIPFDAAYCRDLGYSAVRFLIARRQRRDGQHPGWAAGPDPLRRPPRPGDRQDAGADRGHGERRLPGGARLHDPPGGRGLRARGLGRPPGRGRASDGGRVPPAVRVSDCIAGDA